MCLLLRGCYTVFASPHFLPPPPLLLFLVLGTTSCTAEQRGCSGTWVIAILLNYSAKISKSYKSAGRPQCSSERKRHLSLLTQHVLGDALYLSCDAQFCIIGEFTVCLPGLSSPATTVIYATTQLSFWAVGIASCTERTMSMLLGKGGAGRRLAQAASRRRENNSSRSTPDEHEQVFIGGSGGGWPHSLAHLETSLGCKEIGRLFRAGFVPSLCSRCFGYQGRQGWLRLHPSQGRRIAGGRGEGS